MNLFDQINKLRSKQSSSSSSSSSSTQTSDEESSHSNIDQYVDRNNDEEYYINDSDKDEFSDDMQQSSFLKQGSSETWGPTLVEYRIQPNKIEKKLGMFQNPFFIPEYDPFKPVIANKAKTLYELPNVSRIEIEDIISQRNLFDE